MFGPVHRLRTMLCKYCTCANELSFLFLLVLLIMNFFFPILFCFSHTVLTILGFLACVSSYFVSNANCYSCDVVSLQAVPCRSSGSEV